MKKAWYSSNYKSLIKCKDSKNHKAFANGSLANIKFSKSLLSKIVQLEGFLGKTLGLLTKTVLYLIENVLKPLAKSVFVALELTAVA